MKRFWSLVAFILACCLLIGAIGWGMFGLYETYLEVVRLKALPSASGVDYLGVHLAGIWIGSGVFLASVPGMIFAGISRKVVKNEKLRTASGVMMVLFGVLLVLSVIVSISHW
jgi:hypothetical protein